MVNFGLSTMSLLGMLNIVGAILYFGLTFSQIIRIVRGSGEALDIVIKVLELVWCPFALLVSGIILLFTGWRLDPALQFQQLLLESIVIFLILKDFRLRKLR